MNNKKILPLATILFCAIIFSACTPKQEEQVQEVMDGETMMDTSMEDTSMEKTNMEMEENMESDSVTGEKVLSVETSYTSPAGEETVSFALTVDESGVITDASSGIFAENPVSVTRQTSFSENIAEAVVGKNINELEDVDRIGGSSLTTGAFNASLEDLRAQL